MSNAPAHFDPSRPFETVQEAMEYIYDFAPSNPMASEFTWLVIKANVDMGETGFAADLLREYFQ